MNTIMDLGWNNNNNNNNNNNKGKKLKLLSQCHFVENNTVRILLGSNPRLLGHNRGNQLPDLAEI